MPEKSPGHNAPGHNAPGEGSISQRPDGRWQASLQVAGVRKTAYGSTRSEAVAKLRELAEQARKAGGRHPSAGKLTTADFLSDWLETAGGRLRPTTLRDYEAIIRLHVVPSLGRLPLAKLGALDLARHCARLGKTLSPRRVQMVHRLLHKALGDAAKWGLVAVNVAGLVDAPRPERPETAVWQPEEVGRFVRAMLEGSGGQYGSLFTFLLASGCRKGEAAGLLWSDLDWSAGSVKIERQITHVKSRPVELPPKSRAGRRSIVLPPWGVEALRQQRTRVAEWRLRAGEAWAGGEHVFTSEVGTPPNPPNVLRAFKAACEHVGVPAIRLHDLRHTHVSLLAMSGVPVKVAQARAGHASAALTLGVYSHVLNGADRAAAEALDRALASTPVARATG